MFICITTFLSEGYPLVWYHNQENNTLIWTTKTTQSKDSLSSEKKEQIFEILKLKENFLFQKETVTRPEAELFKQETIIISNASHVLKNVTFIHASETKEMKRQAHFFIESDRDQIRDIKRGLTLKEIIPAPDEWEGPETSLSSKDSSLWGVTRCYENYFPSLQKNQEKTVKDLSLKTIASFTRELIAENNVIVQELKQKINKSLECIFDIINLAYQKLDQPPSEDIHKKLVEYFRYLLSKIMEYDRVYKDQHPASQTKQKHLNRNSFHSSTTPSKIATFVKNFTPLSLFVDLKDSDIQTDKELEHHLDLLRSRLQTFMLKEELATLGLLISQVLTAEVHHRKKVALLEYKLAKKPKEFEKFPSFFFLIKSNCELKNKAATANIVAEVITSIKNFYNDEKEVTSKHLGILTSNDSDFYLSPKWAESLKNKLKHKGETTISDCVIDFLKENLPLSQIEDSNIIEDLDIHHESLLPSSSF